MRIRSAAATFPQPAGAIPHSGHPYAQVHSTPTCYQDCSSILPWYHLRRPRVSPSPSAKGPKSEHLHSPTGTLSRKLLSNSTRRRLFSAYLHADPYRRAASEVSIGPNQHPGICQRRMGSLDRVMCGDDRLVSAHRHPPRSLSSCTFLEQPHESYVDVYTPAEIWKMTRLGTGKFRRVYPNSDGIIGRSTPKILG